MHVMHVGCRLVAAYNQSAATLNLLRAFCTGGYAGLDRVLEWNLEFMGKSDEGQARDPCDLPVAMTLNCFN